ncbi:MAG: hypothetical protein ACK4PR_07760, partial [Gammaproteobacteria bacterium]
TKYLDLNQFEENFNKQLELINYHYQQAAKVIAQLINNSSFVNANDHLIKLDKAVICLNYFLLEKIREKPNKLKIKFITKIESDFNKYSTMSIADYSNNPPVTFFTQLMHDDFYGKYRNLLLKLAKNISSNLRQFWLTADKEAWQEIILLSELALTSLPAHLAGVLSIELDYIKKQPVNNIPTAKVNNQFNFFTESEKILLLPSEKYAQKQDQHLLKNCIII